MDLINNKSIVLVSPHTKSIPSSSMENIGIGYLAANLEQHGYNVFVIEAALYALDEDYIIDQIVNIQPFLIGFSVASAIYLDSIKNIITKIHQKNIVAHITLGSYYPSNNIDILKTIGCDSILYGEGDYSVVLLADALFKHKDWENTSSLAYLNLYLNKIIINKPLDRIENLDILPFPKRVDLEFIKKTGRVVAMSTSRGCYGNCSFCAIQSTYPGNIKGRKWIGRSAENIVSEMKYLRYNHGIKEIWFMDPNFLGDIHNNYRRAYEFYEIMKQKRLGMTFCFECRTNDILNNKDLLIKLKEVGLKRIFVGIESGIQRSLDLFNKNIKANDNFKAANILKDLQIHAQIGFILYDPQTTIKELQENIKFIAELGFHNSYANLGCNYLGILKNTPIYNLMIQKGENNINDLGWGYKFDATVLKFYKLICNFKSHFHIFSDIERVAWRDYYNMNNDSTGKIILETLLFDYNKVMIQFMQQLVDVIAEQKSNARIVRDYLGLVSKFNPDITRLEDLFKTEENYRRCNNINMEVFE